MNAYPTNPPVYHADLYRIGDEEEYEDLDLEAEAAEGILIIEWAERAGSLLEDADLDVTIGYRSDTERTIDIKTRDPDREQEMKHLLAGDGTGRNSL